MEFSKLTAWIGLSGLTLALAGCPGDDSGTSDTMATTMSPTTSTTNSTNPTTDTTDGATGNAESSTGAGSTGEDTTGGVTCDPPCEAGQMCVSGTCFDVDDSSSGEPPAECGLGVMLQFPNPACGDCLAANCCMQLQGCFGDETVMMETECLQLNNCIFMNCQGVMPADLQMCIQDNCGDFAGSLQDWIGYQMCAGANCAADCS